jgi:hypothetical protein
MSSFSKEERVAFEDILEGFDDQLVLSRNVRKYTTDQRSMERSNDTIWRPMPYIANTFSGADQTANFQLNTQLSVPSSISNRRSAPWILTDLELRDQLQEGRLGDAAKQKLASQGTLVVKRTVAASGFDDVAQCDAIFNEQGIPSYERYLALSTRDYNGMAANLQVASRSFGNGKSDKAYENAFIGPVASFNTYKLDYANRLQAAAGGAGLTVSTLVGAANFWVPKATSVAVTGETSNVDNRFQRITISSTTNVVAGDAFTIAGVNAVHHITKGDTGQLKTFRVISVDSATTMTISPPIISAQGASDAERQYQNVTVTPSATAAIVFLNTVSANINCFWQKDAMEILPGRIATPSDAGVAVMRGTTDQGLELVMQKFADINTGNIKYRMDTLFGTVMANPEMAGIMIFSQS